MRARVVVYVHVLRRSSLVIVEASRGKKKKKHGERRRQIEAPNDCARVEDREDAGWDAISDCVREGQDLRQKRSKGTPKIGEFIALRT